MSSTPRTEATVDPFEPTEGIRRHPGSQLRCVNELDVQTVGIGGRAIANWDDFDHVRFLPSAAVF
jgi:hypothetical protein